VIKFLSEEKKLVIKMVYLSFHDLLRFYKSCLRKGLWNRFSNIDKAFYIACMKLSKIKKIVNKDIIETLTSIMKKISSFKEKMMNKGKEVAERMVNSNLCAIVPKVKEWIKDPNYIFWLGLTYSSLNK